MEKETLPPTNADYYKTIDENLRIVKISIENTISDPDLASALAQRGYDKDALKEGLDLYNKAESLHLSQKSKYGDKFGATDEFSALWDELDEEYSDHRALARIALKNNRGELEKIQVNSKRKRSISGWLSQAKAFYSNALSSENIKAAFAKKGITDAELSGMLDKIKSLESKEASKYSAKGAAQSSTEERDHALDQLLEWHRDFIDTSKIALKKDPQRLEKLGIRMK